MTRRTALALATSVALSAAGVTFAVGTTLGLFGAARSHRGPTGELSPVADSPRDAGRPDVETVYVDLTAPPEAPATTVTRPPAAPRAAVETVLVDDPAPTPVVSHEDGEHEPGEPSEGPEGDD